MYSYYLLVFIYNICKHENKNKCVYQLYSKVTRELRQWGRDVRTIKKSSDLTDKYMCILLRPYIIYM